MLNRFISTYKRYGCDLSLFHLGGGACPNLVDCATLKRDTLL